MHKIAIEDGYRFLANFTANYGSRVLISWMLLTFKTGTACSLYKEFHKTRELLFDIQHNLFTPQNLILFCFFVD